MSTSRQQQRPHQRQHQGQHQGHQARKRFGQNFLVDQGVIDAIIDTIRPQHGERMVEIGPGLGALTGPLIARLASAVASGSMSMSPALSAPPKSSASPTPSTPPTPLALPVSPAPDAALLHAVELDRDLIARLRSRFGARLALHAGDALGFDFSALAAPGDAPSLRIVGNLPYNISSPLLFHLTRFAPRVLDQHFMLQSEVVERMVAAPGSKAFGRLTVMLQYRYAIDWLLDVPPDAFQPPPKVDSAIVRMIPWAPHELPAVNETVLGEFVTAAFSQRRKMLRNTLADYRPRVDFDALGFDLARRAEDVSVQEYVRVAQTLAGFSDKHVL